MKDSATKVGASIEGTALRRLRAVRLRPTIARIGVFQVLEAQGHPSTWISKRCFAT